MQADHCTSSVRIAIGREHPGCNPQRALHMFEEGGLGPTLDGMSESGVEGAAAPDTMAPGDRVIGSHRSALIATFVDTQKHANGASWVEEKS